MAVVNLVIWASEPFPGPDRVKVYTFLFKINCQLHEFPSVEFTEVINNGDSLTYKTRMDLK